MLLLNLCCCLRSGQAPGAGCFYLILHRAKDKLEQAPYRGFLCQEDSSQQMKWTCPDGINFHEDLLQDPGEGEWTMLAPPHTASQGGPCWPLLARRSGERCGCLGFCVQPIGHSTGATGYGRRTSDFSLLSSAL